MPTSSFLNTCTLAICVQVHVHCTVWLLSYFWSALWLIIIKKNPLIITTTNQNKGKIICLGCGKMLHNDLVAIGFSFAPDWLRIAGVIWRNLRAYRAEGKTTNSNPWLLSTLPYPPEFRIHILDIPLERLTFQFLAQCKSALNAVKRDGGTKVIIRIKERTSTAII